MTMHENFRSIMPSCLGRLPQFRGKGRLTLFVDAVLTDHKNPQSYQVTGWLNDGVKFNFDLRPWGQKFAYYYQRWEKEYISVLKRLYSGGCFIDVGSSLGLYVACLGELVRSKNGTIISVEPVPYNLERQKRNVALNGLEDIVHYVPCALGDQHGSVKVQTDESMADNNAFITEHGGLEVDVMTLDELSLPAGSSHIGLIKMDVEGYEPLVIKGATSTIRKHRPLIFAEFCRERMDINGLTMHETWRLLVKDLKYECYILKMKTGKLLRLNDPVSAENLYFIPAGMTLPSDMLA